MRQLNNENYGNFCEIVQNMLLFPHLEQSELPMTNRWTLTRVLFCVCDNFVATKYWTGANTAMMVAPIKALIPKR